jgi:flavin reductase (DIM6/NTAB) family NADH-FMN oxidoreductase RutF
MPSSVEGTRVDAAVRPATTLRQCLGRFATGVTIVTYPGDDGPRGLTVNSFTSVSLDPPLVLVCLDRRSRAAASFDRTPFAVNVLHARQRALALHFAGRPREGLVPDWSTHGGVPLLQDSLAWLVCEPWQQLQAGDHVVVLGKVSAFGAADQPPLCFFRGEFLELAQPPAVPALSIPAIHP